MASTGNVFPATGENNAGIGATAWTSPGNIVSDNTTDATCNAAASSQYLVARNFDFSAIPAGATITGITVRIEASESSTGTESLNAQLQNDSAALVGSSKAATINGTTKTVYTYGSTSDVWGATLTRAIVQNANFGVRFWFTTSHNIAVDYVTLAVEYTPAATGALSKTLPMLTIVAAGKVALHAIATQTLPMLTLSAAGRVSSLISGAAANVLPMLTLSAAGRVQIRGALDKTFPMLTGLAAGTAPVHAAGARTLPMLTLTASGVVTAGESPASAERSRHRPAMARRRFRRGAA